MAEREQDYHLEEEQKQRGPLELTAHILKVRGARKVQQMRRRAKLRRAGYPI